MTASIASSTGSNLYEICQRLDWVTPRQVNIVDHPEHSDAPYYFLLVDYQDKVTPEGIFSYSRSIEKINDSSRIEEASLILSELNKENQKLMIHSLHIIRNGERINALDPEEISVIQRERSLESHITDNRLTVSLNISDLREGDFIEYESTFIDLAGEHPFNGKQYHATKWLQWGCPVLQQSMRVINQTNTDILAHKSVLKNTKPQITDTHIAAGTEFEEHFTHLGSSNIEETAPSSVWPDFIQFTNAQEWHELSSYLYQYYQSTGAYTDNIDLDGIDLLELTGNKETDALRIIRFVQNHIRYKGENHGIYSHTPKSPDIILKKRAGDCKDKSNLLVTLLRKIGVEAHLVLVNTKYGHKLAELNPSAYQFNHMVVQVIFNDKTYYFDSTIQKQGGSFARAAQIDFGYGLKLSDDKTTALVKLPFDLKRTVFKLKHEFDFINVKEKAVMNISRQFYYHRADNMRSYFSSTQQNQLDERYLQWAKDDTNLELKPLKPIAIVNDDDVQNVLETHESYEILNLQSTHKDKNIELFTDFIRDLVVPKTNAFPVAISVDGISEHKIFVKYKTTPELMQDKINVVNQYFNYNDEVGFEGKTLVFESSLEAFTNDIPADEIDNYVKDVHKVRERSVNIFPHKQSWIKEEYMNWLIGSVIVAIIVTYKLYEKFIAGS